MYDELLTPHQTPSLAKGKSFSYKKQLFQTYFIANSSYLVGNAQYRNWQEWIQEQMIKMGREVDETESKSKSKSKSKSNLQSIEEVIQAISAFNQNILTCIINGRMPSRCEALPADAMAVSSAHREGKRAGADRGEDRALPAGQRTVKQ